MSENDLPTRIAYLGMIQNVITRMAGNSATAKNLCMTIVAALLAIFANSKSVAVLYVCFVPILLFLLLDARYLRLERAYRALYESTRKNPIDQGNDFSLTPSFIAAETTSEVVSTWSVLWFYVALAGCVILVLVINCAI